MVERMLENGQVVAARYVLLRKLGAGRNSQVWLARELESDREYALKMLDAHVAAGSARAAFLSGARLQQSIEHPNVLRCLAVDETDIPHAVFEYCARGDASQLRGRPWHELVPVLGGVAAGVAALHAKGLVHRDLKPANVLLPDDDTPKLSDLGLAARMGDPAAERAGSPFSASPQQLAGEPPHVADDLYGFGALSCELLTGYPPHYPDVEQSRASGEPVRLDAEPALPAKLDSLLRECLADDPAARPADMATVRSTLRAIAVEASAPAGTTIGTPVSLRAPQDSISSIEPQWRRARDASRPDPGELRAQKLRRVWLGGFFALLVVAAGAAFVVLPRWFARPVADAPAPAAAAPEQEPGPKQKTDLDLRRLAEIKLKFDELRPEVAGRLQGLEGRHAVDWGGDTFSRGKDSFVAADADYGERDYDTAFTQLEAANTDFIAVEKSAAEKLRAALAAAETALQTGITEDARAQFELALKIDPQNAAAKRGAARAASRDEVRRLLADAALQEQNGNPGAAEQAYRAALKLDADASEASTALARLKSAETASAFSAAVAQGLAALARKDPVAAQSAFKRAEQIRPGSPEVQDGLAQAQRALGGQSIAEHLAAAQSAERQERWSDALAEFRKVLAIDANVLAAQQGVERTEPRAMLDAELRSYTNRPERLFTPEVRNAARNAVGRAQALNPRGPVLEQQIAAVNSLITAAEQPVRLALQSDSMTEVTIYRIGKLGAFDRREMELLPGKYTVVGTRAGFRDVRRDLTILPGQPPASVVIRCEDPI
jgi:tetratricopeptide (TPR) repeat protein